jgi:Holliday junction resolvase RusA-like endonuclease
LSWFLAPTKPDLDNQIKTVLDALEGLAYNNDSQVVDISAHKRYANYDAESEYAVIEISEIK